MLHLGKFDFLGPYQSIEALEDLPGVFAVLAVRGDQAEVIDLGTAGSLRTSVEHHDRRRFWQRAGTGSRLIFAATYTPRQDLQARFRIERELRSQYRIPFGGM